MIKKQSSSTKFFAVFLFFSFLFPPFSSADLYYRQNDHGKLSGLGDDDHTQYAILAGRSGGQTLIAGTGAGDDLHLQTTSNGSKGTYFFDELTSNGFLKTSGSNGAVSVDTSSYLTAEVDGSTTNEIEVVDEAYSAGNFNGGTTSAVSQDDFYDLIHIFDTDDDGLPNKIDSTTNGYVKTYGGDGTLGVSTTVDDDDVAFDDTDSNWTATTIGEALEELDDVINGGLPNAAAGKLDWSQIVNVPAGFADGTDDESAGSSTKWNAIGDADGNGTVAFLGTEQDISSTLDGGDVLTLTDTDADLASDTTLLKLAFNDGADANGIYLALIGDADGTPTNDYLFTQSAFTSLLPVNVPAEAYDATGWNGDTGAPQKDAVRDQFEALASLYQPLEAILTDIADGTIAEDLVNTANPWADNEVSDTITVGASGSVNDSAIPSGITRDTEWDTEGEVQTAWGAVNILLETEIDASSELLALMDDETGTGLLTFATNPLFTAARFGNGATTGGYFDVVEDTDNGTNRIRFTAPNAITSDQECVLENDGNPIPDSCVGDGVDGGGSITGTDTHVTFFDGANSPAGDAGFTYNKTTDSATLAGDLTVATEAYDATGWNGDLTVPTKDAVRDKIEGLSAGSGTSEVDLDVQEAKLSGAHVLDGDVTEGADIVGGDGAWKLNFDATTDEGAVWQKRVPSNFTGIGTLEIDFSMASGEANEVQYEAEIMCYTPTTDTADIDTPSFAAIAEGSATTVSATAGEVYRQSITLTDDSCAVGDLIFLKLSTDADDATNDDATGDRETLKVVWNYD